jgi:molybdopterin/thiamine biosynthesis adenylyltransferase
VSGGGVLLIGAGGLGCGAGLGLGAAGVSPIGVVDDDAVEISNLHRQLLHREVRLARPKTDSFREEMGLRFPELTVTVHPGRLTAANAGDLLSAYDVVIDGSDNLATKFLANDAAVLARKPLVHAAAVGTTGQLLTVPAGGRPCYRCLFEELPPADADAPSCAEAGVLGPVPGVLGALAAIEAVRLLRQEAAAFVGRLLRYEGSQLWMRTADFKPNPSCRVCGERPTIRTLESARYQAPPCAPQTR